MDICGNLAFTVDTKINDLSEWETVESIGFVQSKDCKHNPKDEWFGCPMSHLNEKQRPETAWCWKGERRTDGFR